MSGGQQRVGVLRLNCSHWHRPSWSVLFVPTQSYPHSAMMNLQLRVVGHIGPNRTAIWMRIRSFHQRVHALHNHEKLVVEAAAYPSQHSGIYFWSSSLTHYSCEVLRWAATLLALLKYPFYPLFILNNGMILISKSLIVLTPT